ncbi:hypothetical protein GQ55_1G277300 [Panicum hallii var. hallii]|uniref:non-specific serine/threonine protein kinase n=1 Tax=Panicum hallii var. hallii TaxID=1504633 RepID=A0A2T7F8B2_9POAL|nr:hypothetical protein GQ55_1G277300 [Panicum hallii var. hallii]
MFLVTRRLRAHHSSVMSRACHVTLMLLLPLLLSNMDISSSSSAASNGTDLSVLLVIKAGLSDPLGILSGNWTPNSPFCDWVGVSCSRRRQRVTALELPDIPLQGELSAHLGNLSFLHVLNLTNTRITGPIPSDIGRLPRLRVVDLSHNSLSGSIPESIGSFIMLQVFSLEYNQLSGPIPPSIFNMSRLETMLLGSNNLVGPIPHNGSFSLPMLQVVVLSGNNFTGPIPSGFAACQHLRVLNLANTLLEDVVPTWLAKLPQLTLISMGGNGLLTGSIPSELSNLTRLQALDLSFSNLHGEIPGELGKLEKLTWLQLQSNQLTGSFPASLGNLSQLYQLALDSNHLTGSVPETVGNLRLLYYFDIGSNLLTGTLDFLPALSNCRQLRHLGIHTCFLTGSIPASIGNLSRKLKQFGAHRNYLTGSLPTTISNLSGLNWLKLSHNNLSGIIPESITLMENLEVLDVVVNFMSGPIPTQIGTLTRLHMVFLEDNKFSGTIPNGVSNLSMLEQISLSHNQLSSSIPEGLFNLSNLAVLSLSHNSFTGALHSDLSPLGSLYYVDISSNSLVGTLPDSFGNLGLLSYLDLSHNTLQGSIPESYQKLIDLGLLDLSFNNLSGTIPKFLANFTLLTSLNLSFNEFQGEIPNGGIFSNISAQSLMGNPGLCGSPPLGFSPCRDTSNRTKKQLMRFILPTVLITVAAIAILLYLMVRKNNNMKRPDVTTISVDMGDVVNYRIVSYHEIARATENFNEDNLLGVGSFGKVFKGQLDDGSVVAIKVLNMQLEQALRSFDAECQVLRMAKHRNLIRILSTCSSLDFRVLLLQYMPNGNLDEHLHTGNREPLGFIKRLDIMLGVSEAMEYLHHYHHQVVVHCDLKPSNVLFDEEMTAHVSDFGIAKLLLANDNSISSASMPGTIGYIAPELAFMGKASPKSDVFSFGIMLLEVFTGKRPTDPMFVGETSLRQWVSRAFPAKLIDVVDEKLLQDEVISHGVDHQTNTNSSALSSTTCSGHFLVSIFELGLVCSSESPEQRMAMNEVTTKLKNIKQDHST